MLIYLQIGDINYTHFRAYTKESILFDPDTPIYHEALTEVHVHICEEAVIIEIHTIIKSLHGDQYFDQRSQLLLMGSVGTE